MSATGKLAVGIEFVEAFQNFVNIFEMVAIVVDCGVGFAPAPGTLPFVPRSSCRAWDRARTCTCRNCSESSRDNPFLIRGSKSNASRATIHRNEESARRARRTVKIFDEMSAGYSATTVADARFGRSNRCGMRLALRQCRLTRRLCGSTEYDVLAGARQGLGDDLGMLSRTERLRAQSAIARIRRAIEPDSQAVEAASSWLAERLREVDADHRPKMPTGPRVFALIKIKHV